MNKVKGDMYGFIDYTINFIKGKCEISCIYCYMKNPKYNLKDPRLVRKEFKEFERDMNKEGDNLFIFVGSSIDMFAPGIPSEWITEVLTYLRFWEDKNKWLFQSKNPARFLEFFDEFPRNTTLATTIETNRIMGISNAPPPMERAEAMREIKNMGTPTMITVEPVLDFDFEGFIMMLYYTNATQINIGAVTGGHELPEPSKDKLRRLIKQLKPHLKNNIDRLLK